MRQTTSVSCLLNACELLNPEWNAIGLLPVLIKAHKALKKHASKLFFAIVNKDELKPVGDSKKYEVLVDTFQLKTKSRKNK